ncbi:polyprenyl synthetase family protein [Dactylosporangium sp. NPDC000521]|uniref:polyprenyl synthetase family protein n=1 Tax=Dactylosporangium sp. NPDC000521 TaxID=3363975 RepID=UPI0036B37696
MVTVLRTVDDVLAWAELLVEPPLRTAVGRLPEPSREVAELQLGGLDEGPPAARTRAALTLVCAGAVGGDPHDAVAGAVAVELVHHWSGLQRDLFDGDLTRRHRPTAWSVVGPHPATLGGQAMLALAFDVAATGDPTRRVPRPLRQASRATPGTAPTAPTAPSGEPARQDRATRDRFTDQHGTPDPRADARRQSGAASVDRAGVRVLGDTVQQLLHGQHTDLGTALDAALPGHRSGNDLLRECITAVEQRSGALFGCACALGALAGGGDPAQVEQLRLFGVRLGLAVRFAEDLQGIWGDPAVTGRPAFADLRGRRRSLPVAAALAAGADELTGLLHREGSLSDADLERAAKVIERSGARSWCAQQADDLLAQALVALDLAIPEPAAVAELVGLARWATRHPA